jgi:hypothetical protein
MGDHGKDAKIVAVVENLRHFVGQGHIGPGHQPAGDTNRPGVLARLESLVAAALLERPRNGLRRGRRRCPDAEHPKADHCHDRQNGEI